MCSFFYPHLLTTLQLIWASYQAIKQFPFSVKLSLWIRSLSWAIVRFSTFSNWACVSRSSSWNSSSSISTSNGDVKLIVLYFDLITWIYILEDNSYTWLSFFYVLFSNLHSSCPLNMLLNPSKVFNFEWNKFFR